MKIYQEEVDKTIYVEIHLTYDELNNLIEKEYITEDQGEKIPVSLTIKIVEDEDAT